jgi:hypothetical protein
MMLGWGLDFVTSLMKIRSEIEPAGLKEGSLYFEFPLQGRVQYYIFML